MPRPLLTKRAILNRGFARPPVYGPEDWREVDRSRFISRCNFHVGSRQAIYYWGIIRGAIERRWR